MKNISLVQIVELVASAAWALLYFDIADKAGGYIFILIHQIDFNFDTNLGIFTNRKLKQVGNILGGIQRTVSAIHEIWTDGGYIWGQLVGHSYKAQCGRLHKGSQLRYILVDSKIYLKYLRCALDDVARWDHTASDTHLQRKGFTARA